MRLLAALLVALALPGAAWAHATMTRSEPGFRQQLAQPPRQVTLRFDQDVDVLPGAIVVTDARGDRISAETRSGEDRRRLVAPVARGRRGAYTVRWHALSADGHVVSGVFTYGVGVAAPPPTEAFGASGPTRVEHAVRWAYFLGLALLVGGLGFRLLVLGRGPVPPALERRFYRLAGIGAVVVLEVGIAAFILRAQDALQLPFGRLLYGDLAPIASGTRFGTAFIAMTLGYALVTALLYLAWLTERTVLLWPAFLVGLGFASGLSLSGHSAADAGSSWLSELADWVHLSAAVLWTGGLVQLLAVVWPAAPQLRATAFLRFSRYATVLVGALVAAGVYLSVLRLPRLAALWQDSYGQVLLVKLALVILALAWGAAHHFLVRPRLAAGGDGLLARLPRSLAGESAVGAAILLVAAILVDSRPPG
jgi:copper transport protein